MAASRLDARLEADGNVLRLRLTECLEKLGDRAPSYDEMASTVFEDEDITAGHGRSLLAHWNNGTRLGRFRLRYVDKLCRVLKCKSADLFELAAQPQQHTDDGHGQQGGAAAPAGAADDGSAAAGDPTAGAAATDPADGRGEGERPQ